VSTTCSFTDSPAGCSCCILVAATGCGMELISCGDRAAAWMPLVRGFVRGFRANIEESTYRYI